MILYFSGTGNSRHAAEKLAELTKDTVRPLAEDMASAKPHAVNSKNPLVFVCPIHYGRLPKIVAEYIGRTPFTGSKEAFFIATCSGSAGSAEKQVLKLFAKKGLRFRGFLSLAMPENDIIDKTATPKEKAKELVAKADETLKTVAGQIRRNEMPRYEEPSGGGRSAFYRFGGVRRLRQMRGTLPR